MTVDSMVGLLQTSSNQVKSGLTANYTVGATDKFVETGALAGDTALTLPAAASSQGRLLTFKAIGSLGGHALTVAAAGSDTIDGSASYTLSAQYKYVTLFCDGATWSIVAAN